MELFEDTDLINDTDLTREDLSRGHAEYVKWLNVQDSLLKQKAKLTWFKDGDRNSKYFHSVLRYSRRKLEIQRIKNHRGVWIHSKEKVAKAAEIIHHIFKEKKCGNIVLKLDMAKAYDGLSWSFLYQVLLKFGFNQNWIDLIQRSISNVWYSIILNGTRHGFFRSSQGLKQGEPISPSLFVIAAESQITHLAYADDIVIFSNSNTKSVKLIMKQIKNYERASGPKKICYFDNMVSKIIKRVNGCQGNQLSHGERQVLIKNALQALSTYILSAIEPPKRIFKLIEQHMTNFFWGVANGKNRYHWSYWKNICLPKDEGGLGIKGMQDISDTLAVKRW
ncbi:uncharacterized protein LOC132612820 [Lycium barbarum]|uniref:uncharacterized protein LOC132612820 n=1 Tax=Lycium barbarum TaxID=112863 RepID=UPI00293EA0A2|nr:uncharacterized protein LOC132612820 [Lycium barbarum]